MSTEEGYERFMRLHASAAEKGWILGKHPTDATYMLVSWRTILALYHAKDLENGYGYSLDEIERIIDGLGDARDFRRSPRSRM
jgi:hypothetical protein